MSRIKEMSEFIPWKFIYLNIFAHFALAGMVATALPEPSLFVKILVMVIIAITYFGSLVIYARLNGWR